MPTGVLRDVWYALANNSNGYKSSLEKVWVRFHDNKEVAASTDAPAASNVTASLPVPNGALAVLPANSVLTNGTPGAISAIELSYQNTECPSFSILPPLKSLTVLEIDECAYLAEMSVLVQRSLSSMRELRVGMSSSYSTGFKNLQTPSAHCSEMDYLTDGGILGLIMSKIYDCREQSVEPDLGGTVNSPKTSSATAASDTAAQGISQGSALPLIALALGEDPRLIVPASIKLPDSPEDQEYKDTVASSASLKSDKDSRAPNSMLPHQVARAPDITFGAPDFTFGAPDPAPLEDPQKRSKPDELPTSHNGNYSNSVKSTKLPEVTVQQRLRLEVLELEKVHFSVPVLHNSIEWSILTSITLLQGSEHEGLWKFLRRTYSPKSSPSSILSPQSSSGLSQQLGSMSSRKLDPRSPPEYRLNLRRIHTDHVSSALVSFLKETLAPNSLEWLILQDRGKTASTVTIESIYRGPLRYHRSSLKKVSIDSSSSLNSGTRSNRWKRWQLSREILAFITSGKMNSIRELGMAIDHKDWVSYSHCSPITAAANKNPQHYFLQRLPNIPHLRSLYLPHIGTYFRAP